jgi:glycosyltransferase involved in cell wall biosynthesis
MSTFNAQLTVKIALESLNSQTFRDFELVVADGASKDKTLEIINTYTGLNIKIISEPDKGIYDSWNKALKIAEGDFIYFLGADDQLKDHETFHILSEFLLKNRGSRCLIYGKVEFVDEAGIAWRMGGESWDVSKKTFFSHMCIPHQGVFHSRALIEAVGSFDDSYRIMGDYEWLLRAVKLVNPIFIPCVVAKFGTGGVSSENYQRSWMETRRARVKNGHSAVTFYDLGAFLRTYGRIAIAKVFGRKFLQLVVQNKRKLSRPGRQ